jgi:hypothetical protein
MTPLAEARGVGHRTATAARSAEISGQQFSLNSELSPLHCCAGASHCAMPHQGGCPLSSDPCRIAYAPRRRQASRRCRPGRGATLSTGLTAGPAKARSYRLLRCAPFGLPVPTGSGCWCVLGHGFRPCLRCLLGGSLSPPCMLACSLHRRRRSHPPACSETSSVRSQLLLRHLDPIPTMQSPFRGASPRFPPPEGGKAVSVRIAFGFDGSQGFSSPRARPLARLFGVSALHPEGRV